MIENGGANGKHGCDNGKSGGKMAKTWVIRGHLASHDFWGLQKLQSTSGATDSPRYAAATLNRRP